uniref:Nuclear transport factor 2 n=1 Tax=Sinocyclocheilus grahami TaxID=75366 RepID=A0A672S9Q2_SINGR
MHITNQKLIIIYIFLLFFFFSQSLPFTKIAHSITAQDHQPTPDSCILSMVVGQLKADDDPIMGFHQSFILKNINEAWVCTNDMFRLALHNFG